MRLVGLALLVVLLAGCASSSPGPAPATDGPPAAPDRETEVVPFEGDITYDSTAEVQVCPARSDHAFASTSGVRISTVGIIAIDLTIEWQPTDPAFTRMQFFWHTFPKDAGVGQPLPEPSDEGVSPLHWTVSEGELRPLREGGEGHTAVMADHALCNQENGPVPTLQGRQVFRVRGNATYEV